MASVIDVSAVIGIALADEDGAYAEAALKDVAMSRGAVPALFWFELRNVLVINERRGRLTQDDTAEFLSDLAALSLVVDHHPEEGTVLDFARHYKLTVYDAAYLELARRQALPLATKDQALIDAAPLAGVTVWQP